jgi:hypothetical protein
MLIRSPLRSTPAERRISREAESAALRQQALALRQTGATYAAIGSELGLCLERARQIVFKAERLINDPRWYDGLPERAIHVLRAHGLLDRPEIEAAHAVAQFSARELMQRANFGRVSLDALSGWLAGHGLTFATKSGAPAKERPSDSDGSLRTSRIKAAPCPYPTRKT